MNAHEYIKQIKSIYQHILDYADNQDSSTDDFQHLKQIFKDTKIFENQSEFSKLLCLISAISKNHHRLPDFKDKINQILNYLQDKIKQTFSNFEIMQIFQSNKQILLFLIQNKIITVDESISHYFLYKEKSKYSHFFYPEIKAFIENDQKIQIEKELKEIDQNIFYSFEEKRQICENESYLCFLIRNDYIDEFISHINAKSIQLSSTIAPSLFETNHFLIDKKVTLIEYASFFGSIKIFQYLMLNGIQLEPPLWLYAIHGNNSEIIQILIEKDIDPEDETYEDCFVESIKCHHNEIAIYIFEYLLSTKDKNTNNYIPLYFDNYNYSFFLDLIDEESSFFYLCKYQYDILVNGFLEKKADEIKDFLVSFHFFLNDVFQLIIFIELILICFIMFYLIFLLEFQIVLFLIKIHFSKLLCKINCLLFILYYQGKTS